MFSKSPQRLFKGEWRGIVAVSLYGILLLALWVPLGSTIRTAAGTAFAYLLPGLLFLLLMPRMHILTGVERLMLALALSLSFPFLITFSLFFSIHFTPSTLRLVVVGLTTLEFLLLLVLRLFTENPAEQVRPAALFGRRHTR